jgi:signal transduction histidine kinase
MNETLRNATHQAQYDYAVLKEFTENAAHELQTPLAVIRSKLDLMIQDEELSESHTHTLLTTYKAIDKLSRLNQSLLLLAKIENKQYDETQAVDLKKKLEEKIEEFEELWASQELKVSSHLKSIQRTMNPELAEILLNNLLSNATRHNFPGGQIRIKLTEQSLIVANTSPHSELDHSRLFTRFYKPAPHNENNGLGLSIIKQICEVSGFQISYSRKDQMHEFKILWKHDY